MLERLAVDAEKRDDRSAALRWWRRAAGLQPHNARITIRLMRALARGGDRPGAIRQAEIYAVLLERELELPPDPTVLREVETIRAAESVAQVTGDWPVAPDKVAPELPVIFAPEPAPEPAVIPAALSAPSPLPRRARPWMFVGAGLLGLGLLSYALWPKRSPAILTRRVLVVPLRNGTGDSTFNLVGPMVAEWVTRGLSETGLVDVIDTRTMLESTLEGDEASLHDVALGAGVGTLLVGSFFRDGDSLRIEMRLTDARSNKLAGTIAPVSAPVTRPTIALELLRQRVTGALAVMFDTRLPNFSAVASQPPTWEAYQEFLLGMRDFDNDRESALSHFRAAMALDTTYWQPRLWAGITSANTRRYLAADSIFRSLAAVRDRLPPYDRASLDYFEGGFVRGDWERSYQGAKRMVELAPGAGHAIWALGNTAQPTNRPAESIAALKRIDLEHGWGRSWALRVLNVMGRSYHRLAQYEEELKAGQRMRALEEGQGWTRWVEIRALAGLQRKAELEQRIEAAMALPATEATVDPFSPGDMLMTAAREVRAHGDSAMAADLLQRSERYYTALPAAEQSLPETRRALARVLSTEGRWSEAGAIYGDLFRADSTAVEHQGGFGVTSVHLGDSATALRLLQSLRSDRTPYRFGQPALWAARIATVLGRREEAVALLHQALKDGLARGYQLHSDPDLAGLWDFPAFKELIRPRG